MNQNENALFKEGLKTFLELQEQISLIEEIPEIWTRLSPILKNTLNEVTQLIEEMTAPSKEPKNLRPIKTEKIAVCKEKSQREKPKAQAQIKPKPKKKISTDDSNMKQLPSYVCEIESQFSTIKESPASVMRAFIKTLMTEEFHQKNYPHWDEDLIVGVSRFKKILSDNLFKLNKIILFEKNEVIQKKNEEEVFSKTFMCGGECLIFIWTIDERIFFWDSPEKVKLGDLMSSEGIETLQLKSLIIVRPPSSEVATVEFIRFS